MSKTEILQELPRLTAEDRLEIRQKLNEIDGNEWLDNDDPLTDAEKSLLEVRLASYEREPDAGSSWEEVEARIRVGSKDDSPPDNPTRGRIDSLSHLLHSLI